MAAASFSPAGTALGFGDTGLLNPADAETEEQKRKRLAAIAQSQSRLSGSSNYSPAGQALMSGGGGLGF